MDDRNGTLSDLKKRHRGLVRRVLREISAPSRASASAQIAAAVMALPAWADATTVLAYAAMPEEVETSALLHGASTHQKTVCLPRMDGDRITFHVVAGPGSGSDLRRDTGQFGILEPLPDAIQWEPNPAERIFVVCPGLAFDLERNRLGRGKGYYDRFLSGLRGVNRTTVGVCFDVQLYEQVPAGPEDRRMDMVVTETRLVGPEPVR